MKFWSYVAIQISQKHCIN